MATWLKKRSRKLMPTQSLPLLPKSELQQQADTGKYDLCTRNNHKRPKVENTVKKTCEIRKWDEINHELLVIIMKKVMNPFGWWTLKPDHVSFVCKSWLLAFLDALFPTGTILDLCDFDKLPRRSKIPRRRYCDLLYLALCHFRPQNHYTKVLFGESSSSFNGRTWLHLGCRMPFVKSVLFPTTAKTNFRFIAATVALCWRNLEEVCCNFTILELLGKHCKCIHSLTLFGRISSGSASLIAKDFPALKHLMIPSCILSVNALSIILDGQKKIEYLDTSHCLCFDDEEVHRTPIIPDAQLTRARAWEEERYMMATANIKTYVQCARENCPSCSPFYG